MAQPSGIGVASFEHAGSEVCSDALNEGIAPFGPPAIMNSERGSRFTALTWTDRLRRAGGRISMGGQVNFLNNIFSVGDSQHRLPARIRRLWRSMTSECVSLYAWVFDCEARAMLLDCFDVDNHRRPHAALDGQPPDMGYRADTAITQPNQLARRVA